MPRIHPTAIIEENVKIGEGTSVWDNVHIRHGATIGEECIVGEKTYIAYDVKIGNRVKINAMVYICAEVTIEDGVMISASTTFTNDRFPRATFPDLKTLRPSEPDEHTLKTLVREGATIGAGCIIGNDLTIGRWAMVGMGSIVTRSVPDFHLVLGSPAQRKIPDGHTREQAAAFAADSISHCLKVLDDTGVKLCLEPLTPKETDFLNTAAEAVALIERLGHPNVKLHLDVKAMTAEPRSAADTIREYAGWTYHFHANDPNLRGPGFGDQDFKPIFAALKETGYSGWVSVEVFDYSPDPDTIATESLRYMRECEG